ncbi:hypothetical protein GCM10009672_08420 [Nesterenkonia lutea]
MLGDGHRGRVGGPDGEVPRLQVLLDVPQREIIGIERTGRVGGSGGGLGARPASRSAAAPNVASAR